MIMRKNHCTYLVIINNRHQFSGDIKQETRKAKEKCITRWPKVYNIFQYTGVSSRKFLSFLIVYASYIHFARRNLMPQLSVRKFCPTFCMIILLWLYNIKRHRILMVTENRELIAWTKVHEDLESLILLYGEQSIVCVSRNRSRGYDFTLLIIILLITKKRNHLSLEESL